MSLVRVVNQGEEAFFDGYLAVAALGGGHAIRLFTNDVGDGLTDTQLDALDETDFTEATFAGYAAEILLNASAWTVTAGDPTAAVGTEVTFTRSSTGTAELIHGYYVTAEADDSLQWFEQFDGPVSIEFEDDELNVTPQLTLDEGGNVPTGQITGFGGASAPTGWLLCNGSAVSRTTFAALFAAIGTAYGSGDGSTTFNVPDLRQRFPLGKAASGTGVTLGGTGGTIDHVHALDSATSHARTTTTGNLVAFDRKTVNFTYDTTFTATGGSSNVASAAVTTATVLGGNTDTANPPFQTVNFIIKT